MRINWSAFSKNLKCFWRRKSPGIITAVGLGGMGFAVYSAVKATPKAVQLIEEKKEKEHLDKLSVKETIKTCGKLYIPAATGFVIAGACMVGNGVHLSKVLETNVALTSACSIAETALRDYKEQSATLLGQKKTDEIQEAVNQEELKRNPITNNNLVITGRGETEIYDPWSARYFTYDIEKLRQAIVDLSYQLQDDFEVTLNDFYDLIDVDHTEAGAVLGWKSSDGPIKPQFSSHLDSNGVPCLVVRFSRDPTYLD